ncbi:MAG: hypothetical protein ACR2RF_02815 [Geminicoccaceae bacterium]
MVLAIWAGCKTGQIANRTWLGWIVGTVMFLACTYVSGFAWEIAGIGWRIKLMNDTSSTAEYY